MSSEIESAMADISDVLLRVNQDHTEALDRVVDNFTDFDRRTLVRTCFSLIETTGFVLRQIVLNFLLEKQRYRTLLADIPQLSLYPAETATPGKTGELSYRPQKIAVLNHLAFAIRTSAELGGTDIDFGEHGWEQLQKTIKIRNRIVHPKRAAHFRVSKEDMTAVIDGMRWLHASTSKIYQGLIAGSEKAK